MSIKFTFDTEERMIVRAVVRLLFQPSVCPSVHTQAQLPRHTLNTIWKNKYNVYCVDRETRHFQAAQMSSDKFGTVCEVNSLHIKCCCLKAECGGDL